MRGAGLAADPAARCRILASQRSAPTTTHLGFFMQQRFDGLRALGLVILATVVALAGCASKPVADAAGGGTPATAASATAPAAAGATAATAASGGAAAAPALVPTPFADAVARAGKRLYESAAQQLGKQERVLVLDPLIDASTGQQTLASNDMGRMLAAAAKSAHPYWTVKEFNRDSLAATPLLLIGTLTAINTTASTNDAADAFRICLRLVDLKTGKVVARSLERATADSVNAEPMPVFRDSPTWHKDKTVNAYIKSCQGTQNVGDAADPAYLAKLPAAAMINEAQIAYGANRLPDALRLYKEASAVAEPDDLRVLNGLYLTSWRLGRQRDATEVFRRIAAFGIGAKQLPLKILFATGKAVPVALPDLQAQYTIWVRELAQLAQTGGSCLRVLGHTSKTGAAAANEALSVQRATYVQDRLEKSATKLRGKVAAEGLGARENLIGLGTDDLRDALDRRVEFRVVDCPAAGKAG
jgi:outer membrane protein OmpA-like peptidoglycan-associated protein